MLYLGPIAGLETAALDGEGSWALLLVEGGVEGRTDLVSPAEVRTRTGNINNKSFQKKVEQARRDCPSDSVPGERVWLSQQSGSHWHPALQGSGVKLLNSWYSGMFICWHL